MCDLILKCIVALQLKGIATPSIARELIEEHLAHNGSTEDEEIIKKALGIVYVGKRVTVYMILVGRELLTSFPIAGADTVPFTFLRSRRTTL